jgi:hypothetical protein
MERVTDTEQDQTADGSADRNGEAVGGQDADEEQRNAPSCSEESRNCSKEARDIHQRRVPRVSRQLGLRIRFLVQKVPDWLFEGEEPVLHLMRRQK